MSQQLVLQVTQEKVRTDLGNRPQKVIPVVEPNPNPLVEFVT